MRLTVRVLLVFFCVGTCLGGHDDTAMDPLREGFERSGSLPLWWSDGVSGDSCMWPGVECYDGYVVMLNLYDNQLTLLPPEIGNLTSLQDLDLNSNHLTHLPPEIGNLASLKRLRLGENRLTRLPPEIGSLLSLQLLDPHGNYLTSLPPGIGGLTSLQYLYLDENQLTHIPPEIGSLTSLSELYLNNNQLTDLPPELGNLTSLDALSLNNNQLTHIPCVIEHLRLLTRLYLHNTQLTMLSPEIESLSLLQELDLHDNHLTNLVSEIGSLTSLHYLDLSINQLTHIPPEIGSLASLQYLDLGTNQLTSMPPVIGNLTSLQHLSFSNNQLTSVPPEIGRLTSLEALDLRTNQLTSIPPEIAGLAQLWNLRLDTNQLTSLPPEIGDLTSLQYLHLNNNQLRRVPAEIGNLVRLGILNLGTNQLTCVPPEIGNIESLGSLHLHNNNLTSVPSEIGNLAHLWNLYLHKNQLTHVPTEIWSMTALRELHLNNNQLTSVPPEIGALTSLDKLDLNTNQLTSVPPEIGSLTSLQELYLHNNQLTALPPEIERLTSLISLYLHNNQLSYLPPEIGLLGSLQDLDLHTNRLTALPPDIVSLTSLLWFDLSDNQLQSLSIHEHNRIVWMDVSNNQLSECSFLAKMPSLGTVDISHNPLIPGQLLSGLQRLEFLTARDCFHDDLSSLKLEESPNLSFVDFSDNSGLTGVLPDALGQLTHLRVLRLRNISLSSPEDAMCESSDPQPCIPAFLTAGSLVARNRSRHFSCYEPRPPSQSAQSSLLIEIDWDNYFHNQLCRCHTGYVGRLGTCHACPENSDCPGDDAQTVMIPQTGYWSPLSGNLRSALGDLSLDEVCPSSSPSSSWLSVCPVVSRSTCSPSIPRPTDATEHAYREWSPCSLGYTGRMCTECSSSYTPWGSHCYSCPSSGVSWTIYGLVLLCLLALGIVLWLWLRKDVNTDAIKTLIFFTQVLSLLPSLGPSVPGSLSGLSEVSSVSSLSIPGLSCVWTGFDGLTTFWFKWILFVCVVSVVCCVTHLRSRMHRGATGTTTSSLIFVVTSLYLPLSSSVLRSLRCEWDSCLGDSYFASIPYASCSTDRGLDVRVLAWILLFLFVLGVPVCLGLIVYRFRRGGSLDDSGVRARFGQLYLCYRGDRWWWEGVVTMRRLLIAGSVSLIPVESGLTPLAVFLLLLGSTELQLSLTPYHLPSMNRLEYGTLLLLGVNVACVFSLGASERTWSRYLISSVLMVFDCLWMVVLVSVNVVGVIQRRRSKRTQVTSIELGSTGHLSVDGVASSIRCCNEKESRVNQ